VAAQVIVLNGGSSSGKSGIARCLQAVLPDPWLALGVDMLIEAMPVSMRQATTGIEFAADGRISVGAQFRTLEAAWLEGVAAMVRAGGRVIVDDVFLSGAASQARLRKAFDGLAVLWVGVRCDGPVAAGREIARGDRVRGMAAAQAETVHRGVTYDLEVDTTHTELLTCARTIATHVTGRTTDSST
jgi:chloramphenicol 3-O phosphotransferase